MSPSITGRTLEEETIVALTVVFPGVEEEPPSGDTAKKVGQPIQGVQAIQGPKASQLLAS